MVRLVSLSDKAYNSLKELKRRESFSDVVLRVVGAQKKSNVEELLKFAGAWKMSQKEADALIKKIYQERKN